jgi:hypothetical protein
LSRCRARRRSSTEEEGGNREVGGRASCVGARPAQIAHRFVGRLGNVDRRQFTGAQQPRQFARIAFVGLDPITRARRRHRGRYHDAIDSELFEPPRNPKTARTGFVASVDDHVRPVGFAQSGNIFFQRMQIMADRAAVSHLAFASFLGDRRGDRVFVDIQANIEFSFHSVCLLVRSSQLMNQNGSSPLIRGPFLRLCSPEQPAIKMNGKHTTFFKWSPARSNPAHSHKV